MKTNYVADTVISLLGNSLTKKKELFIKDRCNL